MASSARVLPVNGKVEETSRLRRHTGSTKVHPVDLEERQEEQMVHKKKDSKIYPSPQPKDEDIQNEDTSVLARYYYRLKRRGYHREWCEIMWTIVDRIQVFAIVWECSQAWPWPAVWLQWTQFAVCMNLDFAALGSKGAGRGSTHRLGQSLYGQHPDYILHIALPIIACSTLLLCIDTSEYYLQERVVLSGLLLRCQLFLYTPVAIVITRLSWCEYMDEFGHQDGLRFSVDQSYKCFDFNVSIARICLIPLALLFLFLVPKRLLKRIDDAIAYNSEIDHEKILVSNELAHVCQLDAGAAFLSTAKSRFEQFSQDDETHTQMDAILLSHLTSVQRRRAKRCFAEISGRTISEWVSGEIWLISPFRRMAADYELKRLFRKLSLVVLWACIPSQSRTLGLMTCFVQFSFGLHGIFFPIFRSFSPNLVFVLTEIAALVNAVYAMLTAWGLRSASVMPKQQTMGLVITNGLAALFIAGWLIFFRSLSYFKLACCTSEKKIKIPSTRQQAQCVASPAARAFAIAIQNHGFERVRTWILTARLARATAAQCQCWRPVETAPIDLVELHLGHTRNIWEQAKRRDTIFEISLRLSLDQLILAHQNLAGHVLFLRNEGWLNDSERIDEEANYRILRKQFDEILMPPQKRVILLKLLAVRYFLSFAAARRKRHSRSAVDTGLQILRGDTPTHGLDDIKRSAPQHSSMTTDLFNNRSNNTSPQEGLAPSLCPESEEPDEELGEYVRAQEASHKVCHAVPLLLEEDGPHTPMMYSTHTYRNNPIKLLESCAPAPNLLKFSPHPHDS